MTEQQILVGLGCIVVLSVGAQWLAWRFHLPSILVLLLFGLLAGPVTRFLEPDALFGELLLPIVSVSVGIILFEGGLSLQIAELRRIGHVVRNLLTIGALVTWGVSTGAAYLILSLDLALATLFGAILVVTGPTVIIPLLRHIRPGRQVGTILRWEGIVIDPIGATLAVLVFEAILASDFQEATTLVLIRLLKTVFIGGAIGVLCAVVMVLLLKHHWTPDFLQEAVTLMLVVSAFAASNFFVTESGLLAVTEMGVVLANQKFVTVKHIIQFKEKLGVLLIGSLFILLSARLQVSDLMHIRGEDLLFLGVLMLVVRPAAVVLSTLRSKLSWRERLFLSWMAPRGIVAAAVASIFALYLVETGHSEAERLAPLTFLVIIGTVAIYGFTAPLLARWLKITQPNPQGFLIVGAHPWARTIAKTLQTEGYPVHLVDNNWLNITAARMEKLPTYQGDILSESLLDRLELEGIGRLLVLTSNDEANSLAALRFAEIFGPKAVYQLSPSRIGSGDKAAAFPYHLGGRLAFGPGKTYSFITERFTAGATIKKICLSPELDYDAFQHCYGETAIPLFLIQSDGDVIVFAADSPPKPKPGQSLICIVEPDKETSADAP